MTPWRHAPLRTRLGLAAYGLVAECATPLAAAYALLRGGPCAARHALALGETSPRPAARYLLWVHGASIGETCSALPLVRALLAADTRAAVLITASTPNALARLAMEDLGPRVVLRHRPHDGAGAVRRFLRHWQPSALLLVESELWPGLLVHTRCAGVPIALVNARLSARSLARWAAHAPAALRLLLGCCSVALAQTPQMVCRLQRALHPLGMRSSGAACAERAQPHARSADAGPSVRTADDDAPPPPPPVLFRGDLKQMRKARATDRAPPALLAALGTRLHAGKVWLAASTHDGEEEAVVRAHAALRASGRHPDLLLVLVPRHPERGASVAAAAAGDLATAGWPGVAGAAGAAGVAAAAGAAGTASAHDTLDDALVVARRSAGQRATPSTAVYVCDTLGELPCLYGLVGVAFVGGSLVPLGGHSLLEAAQSEGGCALLHGPHIENVAHAADTLAAAAPPAARRVADADELRDALDLLLTDAALRDACRAAAAATASELEEGVLERVWAELEAPIGLPPLPDRRDAAEDRGPSGGDTTRLGAPG
jgi:3-deoxy-D-manno-octulosonic-acid transferase